MPRSRRTVLGSGGLVAAALLSGCSAFESRSPGLTLGPILVRNSYANAHAVHVEVERDGDLVRETTVEVGGDDATVVDATWPSDPAAYALRYSVEGPDVDSDTRTKTITAADGRDDQTCAIPAITLLPNEPPYVQVGNAETMGPNCRSP